MLNYTPGRLQKFTFPRVAYVVYECVWSKEFGDLGGGIVLFFAFCFFVCLLLLFIYFLLNLLGLGDHISTVWHGILVYNRHTVRVVWRNLKSQGVTTALFLLTHSFLTHLMACSSLGEPFLISSRNAEPQGNRSKSRTLTSFSPWPPKSGSVLLSLWNPFLSRERRKWDRWRTH